MSFDVDLQQDNEIVFVDRHTEGGTYQVGGSTEASLNITYNYSKHYFEHLDADSGLRWLNNRRAGDTLERLENAVKVLGTDAYNGPYHKLNIGWILSHDFDKTLASRIKDMDLDAPENRNELSRLKAQGAVYDTGGYWKPTPGNAGHTLNILLGWARQYPDAVWSVS